MSISLWKSKYWSNISNIYLIFIVLIYRQWNISYLFMDLENNGLLIFWNFIEFCLNKIPEKYSGTESNIQNRDFLQKYLAALTINYFHKMLHYRNLTGSLISLSKSKLKCRLLYKKVFEDGKIARYSFSLYYS